MSDKTFHPDKETQNLINGELNDAASIQKLSDKLQKYPTDEEMKKFLQDNLNASYTLITPEGKPYFTIIGKEAPILGQFIDNCSEANAMMPEGTDMFRFIKALRAELEKQEPTILELVRAMCRQENNK